MASQVDTDVAIIGAGSTGLLLAQGLKAAGIPFRIFERHAADHVSREWSMSLHWGGEFLAKVLPPELRDRLDEINVDPGYDFLKDEGFVNCNGETGEVILVMPGVMPRRISRRRMLKIMKEGIEIEHGKALQGLDVHEPGTENSHVTATFSDSTTVTARIVVGCDGSKSQVRKLLIKDDNLASPLPTPYTILNFPYTYPPETVSELRKIHPVFKVSYHPRLPCGYMLSVLDTTKEKETGEVMFQNLLSWKGSPTAEEIRAKPELGLEQLRKLGSEFAVPFRTAALNVADGTTLFADQGMFWDPRPHFSGSPPSTSWNSHPSTYGTITLAGDAGHAMLPHRGQGLNHALEDAARLVEALTSSLKEGKQSLPQAIGEYEEEMVKRGGGEVEVTGRAAYAAHDWEVLKQSPTFKHGANKVK